MNHQLITIAIQELGTQEFDGSPNNPRILQYAEEAEFPEYTDDEIAWCSLFMNWVALKGGMKRTGKLTARSWLNTDVSHIVDEKPEPGDLVIYWRESPSSWKGHVGIFLGYSQDQTRIYTLGGNQNNMVSISAYKANRLLGFRRLKPAQEFNMKDRNLEIGDVGELVRVLQDALKLVGQDPGTSDGHFGPKTEAALKAFQRTFVTSEEDVTGILDRDTRNQLEAVINGG